MNGSSQPTPSPSTSTPATTLPSLPSLFPPPQQCSPFTLHKARAGKQPGTGCCCCCRSCNQAPRDWWWWGALSYFIFEIIGDIFNDVGCGFLQYLSSTFCLKMKRFLNFFFSFFALRHTEDGWKSIMAIFKRKTYWN